METINYNDIDFSELTKLDIQSSESDIYTKKDATGRIKLYKLFKEELNSYDLTLKAEKLKILEKKKINDSIVVPEFKIVDNSLVGTIEDYIHGVDLVNIPAFYSYNIVLDMLLSISENLKAIHENDGIIVGDLNFGNIRIDKDKNHHFLDVLSYSLDKIPVNAISTILLDYLKRNRIKKKVSINNDKISFLLSTYSLLTDKSFDSITSYDLDKLVDEDNRIEKLKDIFNDLKNGYVKDTPYLYELIK